MADFGIYVHLPYCKSICPYCDFNSYVKKDPPYQALTQALIRDLKKHQEFFTEHTLRSVYFGGGTPSLAPTQLFHDMLSAIEESFGKAQEITAEVNPGTITAPKLKEFYDVGINRLSMGWQSTHDKLLKVLGRGHTAQESQDVFLQARAAGFNNLSADLIFAVPGQTLKDLEADLKVLTALNPEHISIYALTYHEETPFYAWKKSGKLKPIKESLELEMMEFVENYLQHFEHYEVSNYAKPGFRSVHNSLYWSGAPYLGIGPGAHGFVPEKNWRYETLRDPNQYIGQTHYEWEETLTARQMLSERFLCGLRVREGIDLTFLQEDNFLPYRSEMDLKINEAIEKNWATLVKNHLIATPEGLRFADSLAALFF